VINFVGTSHKFRLGSVNRNLDFAVYEIVEFGVDHNVVGSLFESVFDSDDFKLVGKLIAYSLQLVKNLEHFFLLGSILASEQV
jgi:hypothetical protein